MEEYDDQALPSKSLEGASEEEQRAASGVDPDLSSRFIDFGIENAMSWTTGTRPSVEARLQDDSAVSIDDGVFDTEAYDPSRRSSRESFSATTGLAVLRREREDVLATQDQPTDPVSEFLDFGEDFEDEGEKQSPLTEPSLSEITELDQYSAQVVRDDDFEDLRMFDFEPAFPYTTNLEWENLYQAGDVAAQLKEPHPFLQGGSSAYDELLRITQWSAPLEEEREASIIAFSSAPTDHVTSLDQRMAERQPERKKLPSSCLSLISPNCSPRLSEGTQTHIHSRQRTGAQERGVEADVEFQIWVHERTEAFKEYQNIRGNKPDFSIHLANIVRRQLAVKRAPRPGVMTRSAVHPAFKIKVPETDFLWELRQLNFDPNKEDTIDMVASTFGRLLDCPWLRTFERYSFATNHRGKGKPLGPDQGRAVHWHRGRMYTLQAEKGVPKEAVFLADVHKLVDVSQDSEGRSYGSPWRFRERADARPFRPTQQALAYLKKHQYWNAKNAGLHDPASKSKKNPPPPKRQVESTRELLQDPLGRVYLDAGGETIIDHPGLPLTIPSAVEGWRIRAMMANDAAVTQRDIVARMPCKGRSRLDNMELGKDIYPLTMVALLGPTIQPSYPITQAYQAREERLDSLPHSSQPPPFACYPSKVPKNAWGGTEANPQSNHEPHRKRRLEADDEAHVARSKRIRADDEAKRSK